MSLRRKFWLDADRRKRVGDPANLYTCVGYYASANNQAAGVVADAPFVQDGMFVPTNNHPIFSESYSLVAATAVGASLTAAQIDSPSIDAFNPMQVYPVSSTLKNAANPNIMDLRQSPILLPINEEIKFQIAGGAGGAEPDLGLIWIQANTPGGWDLSIKPATPTNPRFLAVGTAAVVVLTAGVWSPFYNFTITSPLRGGIYQVNAFWLVCADGLAYQINFPRMPLVGGRKLFPGNLCDQTYGNQINRFGGTWLNGLGRFNRYEGFQIRVLANTTLGAATYTGYADLSYVSSAGMETSPM
jgi:hypothetical protein